MVDFRPDRDVNIKMIAGAWEKSTANLFLLKSKLFLLSCVMEEKFPLQRL